LEEILEKGYNGMKIGINEESEWELKLEVEEEEQEGRFQPLLAEWFKMCSE
jgi:hypothetical protein